MAVHCICYFLRTNVIMLLFIFFLFKSYRSTLEGQASVVWRIGLVILLIVVLVFCISSNSYDLFKNYKA
jgi:hypothetical protein